MELENAGHGTIIMLVHLRPNARTGRAELDPTIDTHDFVTMNNRVDDKKWQKPSRGPREPGKEVRLDYSLRSFCELIFLDPQMKISIQGKDVEPIRLDKSLVSSKVMPSYAVKTCECVKCAGWPHCCRVLDV